MAYVPAGSTCPASPPLSCQSTCSIDHCTERLEAYSGRSLLARRAHASAGTVTLLGEAGASRKLLRRERRPRRVRPVDAPRPPRRARGPRPVDPPRVRRDEGADAGATESPDTAFVGNTPSDAPQQGDADARSSSDESADSAISISSTAGDVDDGPNETGEEAAGMYGGTGDFGGAYGVDAPVMQRIDSDATLDSDEEAAEEAEEDETVPKGSGESPSPPMDTLGTAAAPATSNPVPPNPATGLLVPSVASAAGPEAAATAPVPPQAGGVLDQSFQGGTDARSSAPVPPPPAWRGCNPVCACAMPSGRTPALRATHSASARQQCMGPTTGVAPADVRGELR